MNDASRLTNKIINELYNNDTLLKLLRYPTDNALKLPNLTESEKDEIIKGEQNIQNKRIYKTSCNQNLMEDVRSELRIYKQFEPSDRTIAKVTFYFEIIVNVNCWELDNGEERADRIVFEILNSLQNKDIDGIGQLQFNYPVKHAFYGKTYFGYMMCATTRTEWC